MKIALPIFLVLAVLAGLVILARSMGDIKRIGSEIDREISDLRQRMLDLEADLEKNIDDLIEIEEAQKLQGKALKTEVETLRRDLEEGRSGQS